LGDGQGDGQEPGYLPMPAPVVEKVKAAVANIAAN
jgi:hypothetical protein